MSAAAVAVAAALGEATARLDQAAIPEPRREARLILALASDIDPAVLIAYPERLLDSAAATRFEELLARRLRHEPFARLKGSREFWSLDFALSPETLEPRPDSETLIEAALEFLPDRQKPLKLLDLGTGTGCLLLALLSELPQATGIGIDIEAGAVERARRNAQALGLDERAEFRCGNWDQGLEGQVDVILANPPYIPTGEIALLAPEVAGFEPRLALDGGADGLDAYRILAPLAKRRLAPGGIACWEVGFGQAAAVGTLAEAAELTMAAIRCDLAGRQRCIVLIP